MPGLAPVTRGAGHCIRAPPTPATEAKTSRSFRAQSNAATGGRPSVVLISAYPEQDLEDLIKASPAIGFVSKPELSAAAIIEVLGLGGADPAPSG